MLKRFLIPVTLSVMAVFALTGCSFEDDSSGVPSPEDKVAAEICQIILENILNSNDTINPSSSPSEKKSLIDTGATREPMITVIEGLYSGTVTITCFDPVVEDNTTIITRQLDYADLSNSQNCCIKSGQISEIERISNTDCSSTLTLVGNLIIFAVDEKNNIIINGSVTLDGEGYAVVEETAAEVIMTTTLTVKMTFNGETYTQTKSEETIVSLDPFSAWTMIRTPYDENTFFDFRDGAWNGSTYVFVGSQNTTGIVYTYAPEGAGTLVKVTSPNFGSRISCVIFDGSVFIAGDDDGSILTSVNGTEWNISADLFYPVNDLAYKGTLLLAACDAGRIYTKNGTGNWISRTTNLTNDFCGICLDGPRFVAGGDNGVIMTSTDSGAHWAQATSGITEQIRSICWNGSTYAATGMISSSNGTQWEKSSTLDYSIAAIIWDSDLNKFMGLDRNQTIITSADGLAWDYFSSINRIFPDFSVFANNMIYANSEYVFMADYATIYFAEK